VGGFGKLSRDVAKDRDKVWALNGLLRGERLPDNVTESGRNDDLSTRDSEVSGLSARRERDGSESNVSVYEFLVDVASVLAPGESLDSIHDRELTSVFSSWKYFSDICSTVREILANSSVLHIINLTDSHARHWHLLKVRSPNIKGKYVLHRLQPCL
jgi:hypothetical protein